LVEDLISPLEKQIKEQLADQTKKPPAATSSGRGETTRKVVAKNAGGSSHKETEKGKKRASPPAETIEERGRNKRLKSVVEQTCNEALDSSSAITTCHPSTAVSHTMTAEENESHQGVASAVRRGSNDSTRITKTFDDRIKDLQAFKEEQGHYNVSLSKSDKNKYQSLGSWCKNIRYSYKMIKQEGPTPTNILKLSDVNIQRLEMMGFDWRFRIDEKRMSFDDHIKDLQAFKEEQGHCNVSQSKSDKNKYQSLGRWCCYIRRSYKMIKQEGPTPTKLCKLSDVNIQRLEMMGFDWVLRSRDQGVASAVRSGSNDSTNIKNDLAKNLRSARIDERRRKALVKKSWEERLEELKTYKAVHGDANVPTLSKENPSLGHWVHDQRQQYKLLNEKKQTAMTTSRIEQLEVVGFKWALQRHTTMKPWNERFEELKAYKAEKGNCNVPIKFKGNPSMGQWVSTQRQEYRAKKKGNKTNITEDRIKSLEEVGFVWSLRDFSKMAPRKSWDDHYQSLNSRKIMATAI
jgi:hypothetical protein